ncbi:hypothetical protein [Sorangium sp. So ce362]|uniref:hypothetical protein n=1 Tax=Sorangium sp. So ce362 TaxID=3133303 RepID=UPI003F610610
MKPGPQGLGGAIPSPAVEAPEEIHAGGQRDVFFYIEFVIAEEHAPWSSARELDGELDGVHRLRLGAGVPIVAPTKGSGDEHAATVVEDVGGDVLDADRLRGRLVGTRGAFTRRHARVVHVGHSSTAGGPR